MFSEALIDLKAKELMESPYLSVKSTITIMDAIKKMSKVNSEYLLVEDSKGSPIGIFTYRLLVKILLSKNSNLSNVTLNDISLEPLYSIKSDTKVLDIIKIMVSKKAVVLAVNYKGKIEGVITLHKVLSLVPSIIEDIIERNKFEKEPLFKPEATVMGYCDRCGVWTERLTYVEGAYYCIDCLTDIYGEEFLTEE